MATLRQYYETDFDYALRVKVILPSDTCIYEGAIFFDASANSAFLAFYFSGDAHTYDSFTRFLGQLNYGSSGVNLDGGIILPFAKRFPGQLRVQNTNPFVIEYQLFGDPTWKDLLGINTTRRVFIYSEANLSAAEIIRLQSEAEALGHDLQFRAEEYVRGRSQFEKPQAFISHDSADKEHIARPIAINLQRKLCPVWYDEFSLKLGDNLRQKY